MKSRIYIHWPYNWWPYIGNQFSVPIRQVTKFPVTRPGAVRRITVIPQPK